MPGTSSGRHDISWYLIGGILCLGVIAPFLFLGGGEGSTSADYARAWYYARRFAGSRAPDYIFPEAEVDYGQSTGSELWVFLGVATHNRTRLPSPFRIAVVRREGSFSCRYFQLGGQVIHEDRSPHGR